MSVEKVTKSVLLSSLSHFFLLKMSSFICLFTSFEKKV